MCVIFSSCFFLVVRRSLLSNYNYVEFNHMLNPVECLKKEDVIKIYNSEAWLLTPNQGDCFIFGIHQDKAYEQCKIVRGSLLILNRVSVHIKSERVIFRSLKLARLSKLLAFMDMAFGKNSVKVKPPHWMALELDDPEICEDIKSCERWFLKQYMNPTEEFTFFISILRQMESYCVIQFLFNQSRNGNTLIELGENYGVSYSHFRRLCNHALGGKVKNELRIWRMAQSLLENIEKDGNLTQLALNNGYASSSHFSNEIREMMGVSPRDLSNIIRLASIQNEN